MQLRSQITPKPYKCYLAVIFREQGVRLGRDSRATEHFKPTITMNTFAFSTTAAFDASQIQALMAGFVPEVVADTSASAAPAAPLDWVDLMPHRDYLVRFAKRKLQDPSLAEDVVHDVFEAVMHGRSSFAGRSALRSWLTAILKNKIVDLIRQRARYDSLEEEGEDSDVWQLQCPNPGPHEVAEQRQLLQNTMQRINTLAPGLRDVMEFRVIEDESSEDVCTRLQITESSLFVRLHRARKQLLC